jgi:hypothetical protein
MIDFDNAYPVDFPNSQPHWDKYDLAKWRAALKQFKNPIFGKHYQIGLSEVEGRNVARVTRKATTWDYNSADWTMSGRLGGKRQ